MSRERLNPPGLFKHPYFTRILKVKNPATVIFMAGHTPADENYQPVHPGDLRGQYKAILDALTFQLKEAGATWDDFRAAPPPWSRFLFGESADCSNSMPAARCNV